MSPIAKLPLKEILLAGRTFKTGKPIWFAYKSGRLWPETRFEPAGEWITWLKPESEDVEGYLRFRRPLVLEWGNWKGRKSWVWALWNAFNRLKGAELTKRLQRLRIDGIITVRWDRPYQIVNLSGLQTFWELDTPGITDAVQAIRTRHQGALLELIQGTSDSEELVSSQELSRIFETYLEEEGVLETHLNVWGAWEESTNSPEAQKLCGALDSLGVAGRPAPEDPEGPRKAGVRDPNTLRLIETHYAFAKVLLSLAKMVDVKLYRGVQRHTIKSRKLQVQAREASSWSLSFEEAKDYGKPLGVRMPAGRILLLPGMRVPFNPGTETVALGTSSVGNIRYESRKAKQTGSQTLSLGQKNENWLRL